MSRRAPRRSRGRCRPKSGRSDRRNAARRARTRGRSRRHPPGDASSRSSASRSDVRSGVSPERTSTSSTAPSSASRVLRIASPVPSARSWTATSTSPNASRVAGEATTRVRAGSSGRAASSTQSTILRPRIGWRCLGTDERMRVPRPPAITTAASFVSVTGANEPTSEMAGAPGFEPGIAGPKPAALPLGYAPGH